jgi:uncharacterized membrane protein YfcA
LIVLEPFFYVVAVPAIILTGIGKGGFGAGLGFASVAILTLAIPPLQAAGIMLPVLCVMDLFGVWAYRNNWSREHMPIILLGGLIGIGVGWATASFVDDAAVRLLIGLVAVAFSLNHWLRGGSAAPATARNWPKGVFWSGVSGFTSFVAHAGGPPLSVYLLPLKIDKTVFQATTVLFFTVVNYVKLPPYYLLGQLNIDNLATSLVLLPLAPLSMGLGIWLHKRVSPLWFYRIVYAMVFMVGLKLIWDGAGIGRWLGLA